MAKVTLIVFVVLNNLIVSQTLISLDSIQTNYFKRYNVVFLGEQHNIATNNDIEIKLISLIKDSATKVCLEGQTEYNFLFDSVFCKKDTVRYNFYRYTEKEDSITTLLKYLYDENIIPKAIDVLILKMFTKEEVYKRYSGRELPTDVKNDIYDFMNIGKIKFPYRRINRKRYLSFLEKLNVNKKNHTKLLGIDSVRVFEYFDALEASLNALSDKNRGAPVFSNYREEFMFKMLSKEVNNEKKTKVISVNGNAHINLDKTNKRINNNEFINLASRTKNKYPEMNICSIYLLNLEKDLFFKVDYPEQYNYLKAHTELNRQYIIEIDSSNTMFKDLLGKYTHIVVY